MCYCEHPWHDAWRSSAFFSSQCNVTCSFAGLGLTENRRSWGGFAFTCRFVYIAWTARVDVGLHLALQAWTQSRKQLQSGRLLELGSASGSWSGINRGHRKICKTVRWLTSGGSFRFVTCIWYSVLLAEGMRFFQARMSSHQIVLVETYCCSQSALVCRQLHCPVSGSLLILSVPSRIKYKQQELQIGHLHRRHGGFPASHL